MKYLISFAIVIVAIAAISVSVFYAPWAVLCLIGAAVLSLLTVVVHDVWFDSP